jgi:hypothetical protein
MLTKQEVLDHIKWIEDGRCAGNRTIELEALRTAERLIELLEPLVLPQSLFGVDAIEKAHKEARTYFIQEWENG